MFTTLQLVFKKVHHLLRLHFAYFLGLSLFRKLLV